MLFKILVLYFHFGGIISFSFAFHPRSNGSEETNEEKDRIPFLEALQ